LSQRFTKQSRLTEQIFVTFRQQLLTFSNCSAFSAKCRHRELTDVFQLAGPSSLFMAPWLSCRTVAAEASLKISWIYRGHLLSSLFTRMVEIT